MLGRISTILLIAVSSAASSARATEAETHFETHFEKHFEKHFETRVRPLLAERCWKCHGEKTQKAELRLDSAAGLKRGAKSGAVMVPGDPDASSLIRAVRRTGDIKMPPKDALADDEIAALVEWVRSGAVWPVSAPKPAADFSDGRSLFSDEDKSFWAFQPFRDPSPPEPAKEWGTSDIDRFILARLQARGMSPAPAADKRTLLRRVTFDLIGLPPAPEEIDAFLKDETPEAFSKVVDRLLDSPHYGERWGRHWLGVVRYGDTADIAGLQTSPYAWRYRDYVVRAFNRDKPFNEFIVEQIAGDLLATRDVNEHIERTIATGFLGLGPKPVTEIDKEKMVLEIIDEQIDVTSRAFLGLTVSCARCHDHKFDPIPTEDYYSLASIFYGTRSMADRRQTDSKWMERALDIPGEAKPIKVLAVEDGQATNLRVHLRGSHLNLGVEVPRRFLRIIAGEDHAPIESKGSGRLELARWIASADNPLTARVIVNRIWQGDFRTGLVETSDNFGFTGARPTHPDLLDWLASRFVEGGWSVKSLHRLLLNTSTYRMGTAHEETEAALKIDPGNRFLWRMSPRRLEAEEIRDAILAGNGRLDRTVGGVLYQHVDPRYVQTVVDKDRDIVAVSLNGRTFHPYYSLRRTLYLPMIRQKIPEVLQLFDFGDAATVTTKRSQTTVAPQALFMMNSSFIQEQSFHLARNLLRQSDTSDEDRVKIAHQKVLGRLPSDEETKSAIDYTTRFVSALETVGRFRAAEIPGGALLTFKVRRVPPPSKDKNKYKRSLRLRFSVTSVDRARSNRNDLADWSLLTPLRTASATGAKLPIGAGGTVRVAGEDPLVDTYEVVARTELEKITAVRLEVFPHSDVTPEDCVPDLLVVSEFEVRATPGPTASGPAEERALRLQHALLKESDADVSIFAAIDVDPNTSWHVGPIRDRPGAVIFETEDSRHAAWQSYCRALFSLNEFLYLE